MNPDTYSDAATTVRQHLAEAGAAGEIRLLTEPVPTAAAAATALGCDVGAIANSLIFEVDGTPLLILASGAHRVHPVRLAQRIGSGKIRRADPGFVLAHTGQEVGGVAPVGHPSPLRTGPEGPRGLADVGGGSSALFTRSISQTRAKPPRSRTKRVKSGATDLYPGVTAGGDAEAGSGAGGGLVSGGRRRSGA
jgi:prolyl-tRNA editing enzyme YbaK/EbsC (Cys-tRNA(Pro) deacylase)